MHIYIAKISLPRRHRNCDPGSEYRHSITLRHKKREKLSFLSFAYPEPGSNRHVIADIGV